MQLITAKDTFVVSGIGRKYSPLFFISHFSPVTISTLLFVYKFQVVFILSCEDKLRRMLAVFMDVYFSHSLANVMLNVIGS